MELVEVLAVIHLEGGTKRILPFPYNNFSNGPQLSQICSTFFGMLWSQKQSERSIINYTIEIREFMPGHRHNKNFCPIKVYLQQAYPS